MKFHELRNNYDFCTCNVTCRSFIITCLVNETIINIFEHSDQVQCQIIRVSCRLGCPLITLQINNDRWSQCFHQKSNCVTKLSVSSYHKTCQQKLIMGNYGHVIGFCPDTIRTSGRTGDKARFINHKTQKVSFSFIFINLLWSITGITSDFLF